jgi:signal transduction histidine kinase
MYNPGPNHEKIEDVLFMLIQILNLLYEPREILLEADKSRIAEVISIGSNAIEFTQKGTIGISVEIGKTNKNNVKNWVVVSVKDTGQGIDINILPRLFTKFVSKSHHGTGLGLFISKGCESSSRKNMGRKQC